MAYSKEWYKRILNAMQDLVLVKGPASRILWANQAFLEYYGMTEEELKGLIDGPQSDPDDTLQYVQDDLFVFNNQKSLDIESEAVTNLDGETRDFHTIKTPIIEKGRVIQSVGVSRLIEKGSKRLQKRRHEESKDLTLSLRMLSSYFPTPLILLDIQRRIVSISPLWKCHFGQVELAPHTFFEKLYREFESVNKAIQETLRTQKNELVVEENVGLNKNDVFEFHISPWYYSSKKLGGVIIVATDITSLIKKEKSLLSVNEELMQFSYRASHDLKAPLTTTKRMVDVITDDIERGNVDEALKNLARIKTRMGHLEELVTDILSLAKSDLVVDTPTPVSYRQWLGNICETLREDAHFKGVHLDWINKVKKPSVLIYSTRLQQIIENLIGNSIKHSDPNKEKSWAKIESWDTQDSLYISVSDNSKGIPEEYHQNIFKPFSRFAGAKIAGNGLGLAIVDKHVSYMGGQIYFTSTPEGTTFHIRIPLENKEMENIV